MYNINVNVTGSVQMEPNGPVRVHLYTIYTTDQYNKGPLLLTNLSFSWGHPETGVPTPPRLFVTLVQICYSADELLW